MAGLPYRDFHMPCSTTQPGRPSVGRCNEYRRRFRPPLEKKRRVLRSGVPCEKDCRHTGVSRLKARAPAVYLRQPYPTQFVIGSHPRHLKANKVIKKKSSLAVDFTVYAKLSASAYLGCLVCYFSVATVICIATYSCAVDLHRLTVILANYSSVGCRPRSP